jgi:hypothetical protein
VHCFDICFASSGRYEIAKLLLSRGAYVDGESCRSTPLHAAVTGGHDSTVEILLENHANVLWLYLNLLAFNASIESLLFPTVIPIPCILSPP